MNLRLIIVVIWASQILFAEFGEATSSVEGCTSNTLDCQIDLDSSYLVLVGVTNMNSFSKFCSVDSPNGYTATVVVPSQTKRSFEVVKDNGELNISITGGQEIRITPISYPFTAVITQDGSLITTCEKLAKSVSRVTIKKINSSENGGQVDLLEFNVTGDVKSTGRQGRHGHVPPRVILLFCRSLEVLNVKAMKAPQAFTCGGAWVELRIKRGQQEQILRWPEFLSEEDGDDSRYGVIDLLIDGLLSKIKWDTQSPDSDSKK